MRSVSFNSSAVRWLYFDNGNDQECEKVTAETNLRLNITGPDVTRLHFNFLSESINSAMMVSLWSIR